MADVSVVSGSEWQNKVLASQTPILVDFSATWCGPCRAVKPIVDALAKEFDGRASFAVVDIDEAPEIATQYQIDGVPTLVLFKAGSEVDRLVGAAPKPALKAWLEQHVTG